MAGERAQPGLDELDHGAAAFVHNGEQRRGEGRDAGRHGRSRLELLPCASGHLHRLMGSGEGPGLGRGTAMGLHGDMPFVNGTGTPRAATDGTRPSR